MEPNESFVKCVIREILEETGLTVSNLTLCGIKQFSHKHGQYRYIVILYKTNVFEGELRPSDEGNVFWINRNDITNYRLAKGFDEMLSVFLDDSKTELYYHWDNGIWCCDIL